MDTISAPPAPDMQSSLLPEDSGLHGVRKYKWLIIAAAGLTLIAIISVILQPGKTPQQLPVAPTTATVTPPLQTKTTSSLPIPTPTSVESPQVQMQNALDEAKQSAVEYDTWQGSLHTDYPWLRKFPFASKKYFVYFDLKKRSFVTRLFPTKTDDTETIKQEVLSMLTSKGIPVDSYPMEWDLLPQ